MWTCSYCDMGLGDGEYVAHAACVAEDTRRRNAGRCVACGRNVARGAGDGGELCVGCATGGILPKYRDYPGGRRARVEVATP